MVSGMWCPVVLGPPRRPPGWLRHAAAARSILPRTTITVGRSNCRAYSVDVVCWCSFFVCERECAKCVGFGFGFSCRVAQCGFWKVARCILNYNCCTASRLGGRRSCQVANTPERKKSTSSVWVSYCRGGNYIQRK